MRFMIHGTWPDGTEDSVVIEGSSLEDVRYRADEYTNQRSWTNLWSENLEEDDA